ncbi:Sodium/hydrogen exchanger 9 [Saguinus oedipus]|uniref:Sodium/hydrogen exchanger 9 n=1 Tax=Saguinus oedipus TaxID=9490 RepID=A0ABQ9U0X0_SAGOE|nr:Sodium/hydrogen exchanger 9 [Saguinus oedipus]
MAQGSGMKNAERHLEPLPTKSEVGELEKHAVLGLQVPLVAPIWLPLYTNTNSSQEQLKEDDVECIVNQDELAMNYQEQASSCSPPARLGLDQKASPQTPGKENIYEGDLGLGGYELKLEQTSGQSHLN